MLETDDCLAKADSLCIITPPSFPEWECSGRRGRIVFTDASLLHENLFICADCFILKLNEYG